jgi:hypothetical protein
MMKWTQRLALAVLMTIAALPVVAVISDMMPVTARQLIQAVVLNVGSTSTPVAVAHTNGAVHGVIASGPTGTSALQQQGTAADAAAAVGSPVQIGGKGGAGNVQAILTDTLGTVIAEGQYSCTKVTADTQIKASAGFLHTVTLSQDDAAPTAGTIVIFDDTAESGTQVFEWTLTTTVFMPVSLLFDRTMATGIYAGFTTTADVHVTVCFR